MAMASFRSGVLRAKLLGRSLPSCARGFSSAAHDDVYEMKKWEWISYAGVVASTGLAVWNLSRGHPHFEEPPAYPYLHIRNKEFPWGPDGLFEVKEHH